MATTKKHVKPEVDASEAVNLSFKVAPDVRKKFRLLAVQAELTHHDLLLEMMTAWEKANGR